MRNVVSSGHRQITIDDDVQVDKEDEPTRSNPAFVELDHIGNRQCDLSHLRDKYRRW